MQQIINDLSYQIETSGAGERQALLLHYFGGSGAMWAEVMRRVPGVRCVAPDLAGFGGSAQPAEPYTVDQHAADMQALAEQLVLNSFALVGHSMGGKIAMALAALQPPGLRELILVAPSPPTPEPIAEKDRRRLLNAFGDHDALAAQINGITATALPANLQQQAIEEQLLAAEATWRAWLEDGSREDISAQLSQITVPVTILIGERDESITADLVAKAIIPFLTGTTARISVIADAGHLLPYETPQPIADALTDERG